MRVAWQLCTWMLVAVGLAATIGGLVDNNDLGSFGFTGTPSKTLNDTILVQDVTPGSPAAKAGIRAGDSLQFGSSAANRIVASATVPGDRLSVRQGSRSIDLVATVYHPVADAVVEAVVLLSRLAFLFIAALVAWRRPDDPASRALSVFLACFGTAIGFDVCLLPAVWARFACLFGVQTVFLVGGLAMLAFACRFPSLPEQGLRRRFDRALFPFGLVGFVFSSGSIFFQVFDNALSAQLRALAIIPYVIWYLAIIALSFVAFIDAYRATLAADRVRMRWVLGTFALGFSGLIALFVGLAAGLSGAPATALQYVALTVLAIPFGLGYVILRHRMLDIGFVVNRAVVYTAVSIIIVGAFIVFEWLVGHLVEPKASTSALLQLGAALVLGLSARFIHARVDRYIDDFFFRERHLAEAAIRRFAHEALLITDENDLTTKTVAVVQDNAHLNGAAFYARRDGSYRALHSSFARSPEVSENDFAALEMRAWHRPVDLRERQSAIPGDIAFPMIVRGRLAGFLACGEKLSHEAIAPDERDALALLARDAGVALDSLRVRAIEREVGSLAHDADVPTPIRVRLAGLVAPE